MPRRREASFSPRLLAIPWIAQGVLLLRIAGIGGPGGLTHGLEHDPTSTMVAATLGVVAVGLAARLAVAPTSRACEASLPFAVATGIGACILALDRHQSALLVLALAALTAAASAVARRSA